MGMFGNRKAGNLFSAAASGAADSANALNVFAQVPNALRAAIPAHERLFASTVAGDRTPITEENFSPSELNALRSLVAENERNPFYKRGAVTYPDYILNHMGSDGASPDARAHAGPFRGGFDFGDRAMTAVGNSVGQFRYKRLPDGTIAIDDSYDWDSGRPDGGQQRGRPTLSDAVDNLLKTRSLEQLGAWAVPDAAHGRPIRIRIPPPKR